MKFNTIKSGMTTSPNNIQLSLLDGNEAQPQTEKTAYQNQMINLDNIKISRLHKVNHCTTEVT